LKDVMTTEGLPDDAGSKILQGWFPPDDANVTRRLKQAGIVIS